LSALTATETFPGSSVLHDENRPLQLLLRERDKYLNFLARGVRNRDLAEELLQSVALKVIERGSQLRCETSAEAWLYRILRNTLTDHYRETAKPLFSAVTPALELEIAAPSSVANPCPCASNEVGQLKPEYTDALRSVELGGDSVLNYAATKGLSPNAAYVRLHRARKSLLERVMRTCGPCAGPGCFNCSC